jgi:hypothetical protein
MLITNIIAEEVTLSILSKLDLCGQSALLQQLTFILLLSIEIRLERAYFNVSILFFSSFEHVDYGPQQH